MIRPRMIGVAVAAPGGCLLAPVASAGIPTDQLKGAIERVVKTLENPAYKGEDRVPERRAAVRKIANEIFDFGEIARRSLGRHWQGRTDAEHEEFVSLFADLLERVLHLQDRPVRRREDRLHRRAGRERHQRGEHQARHQERHRGAHRLPAAASAASAGSSTTSASRA